MVRAGAPQAEDENKGSGVWTKGTPKAGQWQAGDAPRVGRGYAGDTPRASQRQAEGRPRVAKGRQIVGNL